MPKHWAKHIEQMWKHRWTAAAVCSIFVLAEVYFLWRIPPAGVAIAVLGGAAAIMSLRPFMGTVEKAVWMLLIGALLYSEIHAIIKDRKDAQDAQNQFESEENIRLGQLLGTERENTQKLLDQENKNFSANLKQDQTEFENTIDALLGTHRQDEKEFADVVQQENKLIQSQQDISEQFAGRLVPGNLPTPANYCFDTGESVGEGEVLMMVGNNAVIGRLPLGVMSMGKTEVVAVNKVPNSDAISLSLDFRGSRNQILLRLNEDGVVNRSALILLHPSKSEFLIEDEFGNEFMRATYLNPKAFQITGSGIYCGKPFDIQIRMVGYSCVTNPTRPAAITFPNMSCPMPPP
jgi:hypothetical protein